jgi:hypothetical protein
MGREIELTTAQGASFKGYLAGDEEAGAPF